MRVCFFFSMPNFCPRSQHREVAAGGDMRPAPAWAVKPKCVHEDKIKRRCSEPSPSIASHGAGKGWGGTCTLGSAGHKGGCCQQDPNETGTWRWQPPAPTSPDPLPRVRPSLLPLPPRVQGWRYPDARGFPSAAALQGFSWQCWDREEPSSLHCIHLPQRPILAVLTLC